MAQYVVTVVIAVLLIAFIIYQQIRTRPINPRQLVVVPLFLGFMGVTNLNNHVPDSTAATTALGASVVTALLFGVARGITTHVWRADGALLRKGTTVTLALWLMGIVVRIAIGVVARREGVPLSVTTGEIPLFLGITLAAQNILIWIRAQETPEPGQKPAA
jgi:hypothetical protein